MVIKINSKTILYSLASMIVERTAFNVGGVFVNIVFVHTLHQSLANECRDKK